MLYITPITHAYARTKDETMRTGVPKSKLLLPRDFRATSAALPLSGPGSLLETVATSENPSFFKLQHSQGFASLHLNSLKHSSFLKKLHFDSTSARSVAEVARLLKPCVRK